MRNECYFVISREFEMEVKKEFENFLSVHFPEASLGDVDEIVLSYIADVLGEMGKCMDGDTSFDAEQFCEMISAYVPEFTSIESSVVCEWMFELVDKQRHKNEEGRVDITEHSITEHGEPTVTKSQVADKKVEAETKTRREEKVSRENVSTSVPGTDMTSEEDKNIVLLEEMFPDLMEETLRSIHRQCRGDVDETIQRLLQLSEQEKVAEKQQAVMKVQHHQRGDVSVDRDLKAATLARYAFVDTDEDKVTHRPVLAKPEPKKMVRYRDGQVVSTKGERYTVMTRKDTEGDDMKNTYINLKPLRKYRFH